jgi:hypothetical protein
VAVSVDFNAAAGLTWRPDLGEPMPQPPRPARVSFFVGIDLGELRDYSALALVERLTADRQGAHYRVRDLRRWELRTPFSRILADVVDYLLRPGPGRAPLAESDTWVGLDSTGVGRAVWQLFRDAPDLRDLRYAGRLRAVCITGGQSSGYDVGSGAHNVPKKDLVGAIQSTLGTGRLRVASGLPLADVLREELDHFRVKVKLATGNESFEAWRERDHDDLVLSLALALHTALWAPDAGPWETDTEPLTPGWRGMGGGKDVPGQPPEWLAW